MMEADFRQLLVAALPDLGPARINWDEQPQGMAGSYIVLQLIDMTEGKTQQGPDGLQQARVQVDCYAEYSADARQLGYAAKAALDGHRGDRFRGIFFDGLRVTRETDENGGEANYRASLDFLTHWRQSDG